jgi:hypothetical protein
MNKTFFLVLFLALASGSSGQAAGNIDKKTKEFSVPPNLKIEFRIFGYQFANISSRKMICFSSHAGDVTANFNECPLGAYYDTGRLNPGDKIVYLGPYGSFGKMKFISAGKKETVFYIPKGNFTLH